jgi:hypothetical protein
MALKGLRGGLARDWAPSVCGVWGALVALAVSGCGAPGPAETLGEGTSALSASALPLAKGLLQDDRGFPVEGALVEVRGPRDRVIARTTTDAGGILSLRVRSGTYDVLVTPASRFVAQRFPGQTIVAGDGFSLVLVRSTPIEHSGRVSDAQGQPLAQARVCLFQTCATTDDGGAFSVTEPIGVVPTSSLSLQISKTEGLASFSLTVAVDSSAGEPVDIVLPLVHVTGTMLDAAGHPASSGFFGSFMCPESMVSAPNILACYVQSSIDAAGRFSLTTLAGDLEVFVLGPVGFPSVLPIADNADLTIVPPARQVLRGRVADSEGNAVASQTVCLSVRNCFSNKACLFDCRTSDADGNYALEMPGGPYSLTIDGNLPSGGNYHTTRQGITLSQPTTLDVTLPLERLTGTVLDPDGAPAANVSVSASCSDVSFDGFTARACSPTSVTGGDGRFQLTFLASSDLVIGATGPTSSASLSLAPTGNDDVVIHLAAAVPATGQVLSAEGTGVPDASVCFSTQRPGRRVCATTGADGSYQLTAPPDSYEVTVTGSPAAVAYRYLAADGTIAVPSPAPPVFRFAPLRTLSARLVGSDGSPVAGATIFPDFDQVKVPGGTEIINSGSQVTDAAGHFVYSDLPGGAPLLGIELPGSSVESWVKTTTSDGAELAIALTGAAAGP